MAFFNINWCSLLDHNWQETKVNRCFVATEMRCKNCGIEATMELKQENGQPLYYWKYSDNTQSKAINLREII